MSREAYNLEAQNNDSLSSLSTKISALRNVTNDIYSQASNHTLIDENVERFSGMQQNLKASMGRLTMMARSGNKVAILKLAGMLVVGFLILYYVGGWIFGGSGSVPDPNGTGH